MSVKATTFVRDLRGLPPMEKLVAFVYAAHANKDDGRSYPSMSTVAVEAGLKNRETASRLTKRLAEKQILIPEEPVRKEQGKPTVYQFNYRLATCDFTVTGEDELTCDSPVTQREKGNTRKGKAEEEAAAAAYPSAEIVTAFEAMERKKPFGSPSFQVVWAQTYKLSNEELFSDKMEEAILKCQARGISVPPLFFKIKRHAEDGEVQQQFQRTPL